MDATGCHPIGRRSRSNFTAIAVFAEPRIAFGLPLARHRFLQRHGNDDAMGGMQFRLRCAAARVCALAHEDVSMLATNGPITTDQEGERTYEY